MFATGHHFYICSLDTRVGLVILPSAAVQVPRVSVRGAGDLYTEARVESSLSMDLFGSSVPPSQQVIKNLLFVGKVIYLVSPESGVVSSLGEVEQGGDDEEEGDEGEDRPPSLMWLIRKLSLMAKREAAYTPKVPLKVPQWLLMTGGIVLLLWVCVLVLPPAWALLMARPCLDLNCACAASQTSPPTPCATAALHPID